MDANDLYFTEKKRKLSDGEESLKKHMKRKYEDIKPNIEVISRNIKREPEFTVKEIKQELDFTVREIKKEPTSDTESITTSITKPKSRKKKRKVGKTRKTVRKRNCRKKRATKDKTLTSKKYKNSSPTKKTKSRKKTLISKKSTSRRKTKGKSRSKSAKSTHAKKEAKTLLDRQSSGNLRLFGFKDELEYFSPESDPEEPKKDNLRSNVIGKRTSLSSLRARKRILLALNSTSTHPTSKPKPVIPLPVTKNVDLLDSILESQTLWHSKNSHMKVNEDGSVELINKPNKNKTMESKLTGDKEINLQENRMSEVVSLQARSDPAYRRPVDVEPVLRTSLNLSENTGNNLNQIHVKSEGYYPIEICCKETVVDENKGQIDKEKIKRVVKKEREDSPQHASLGPPLNESHVAKSIFVHGPKAEKFDCKSAMFLMSSKESKVFSRQKDKERRIRIISNEPEIQIIEIKDEKIEEEKSFKTDKNRLKAGSRGLSPSPPEIQILEVKEVEKVEKKTKNFK